MKRIQTGVPNLDLILGGGLPKGSVTVIAGPPGSGKTILSQQIAFHNASPQQKVLFFGTLSEPTAKTLRYLREFDFFDPQKLHESIQFIDLGVIIRTEGLSQARDLIMDNLRKFKPAIVVIDSFRVFDDLANSKEELRKFSYELAVNLMAWECTAFLLGEFSAEEIHTNPVFSVVDGLFLTTQGLLAGEDQRFFQVVKMRGTAHSRSGHPFTITQAGITIFAPALAMRLGERTTQVSKRHDCSLTGIPRLDDLLGQGIPPGSSLLVSGAAGTGKTALLLEIIYRGAAEFGAKGIYFSFEETEERLLALADSFGWDLTAEVARGLVEIVVIPQPQIQVEADLEMMRQRIEALGADRVAIDSLSVFLSRVNDPQVARDKTFQLCRLMQTVEAVGFFAVDVPYGTAQVSRLGVEETIVDGIILLSTFMEGLNRRRYIEVYKLRNTAHLKGRHFMDIGRHGIEIYPRFAGEPALAPPPAVAVGQRLSVGPPGLDALLGGGVLARSVTLVSGSAGIGKTTMGIQFVLAGVAEGEQALFVTLEEGPDQVIASAEALGLPLTAAVQSGHVEILYLPAAQLHPSQLLSVISEKLQSRQVRRLVLDSCGNIAGLDGASLETLLLGFAHRFKQLGVTSLLTLEAQTLFEADIVTGQGVSAVADNLIMMRYMQDHGQLRSMLTVVKTRGSDHDWCTYAVTIGPGGLQLGPRLAEGMFGGAWPPGGD